MVALVLGILPCLPGFVANVAPGFHDSIPDAFVRMYDHAWFISFGVSFGEYPALMWACPAREV